MHKNKILIIGIDGAGLDLVERFARSGSLPNISSLMRQGISAGLQSTLPPTTLPAWTSFMTGASPSSHGLPDFTIREGYGVRFAGGPCRRLPTLFTYLENCGLRTSAAWFPATYPPESLSGYHISGWDSPVTAQGNSSFVHPTSLHRALLRQFGGDHVAFDTVDEFRTDEAWYLKTAKALVDRVTRRAEMAAWLMTHHPTDVAGFYFGETDTAAHHFWAFCDPTSPRRPKQVDPRLETVIEDVYQAIDAAVGLLVETAEKDATVVILSDHGSGGSSDIAIYLNRMLADAGLLKFRQRLRFNPAPASLRNSIPGLIPAKYRRRLFRLAGGLAPAFLESRIRFANIDWHGTSAFSEEINYAPSVWYNLQGREPKGTLHVQDRDRVFETIERAAKSLKGPGGSQLIDRVMPRESIHSGRYVYLFPDIIIEPARPGGGYTPAFLPSKGRVSPITARLNPADQLGPKGRSLPGCHTPIGILIAAGQGLPRDERVTAHIQDVAPLITSIAGVSPAPWFEGQCPIPMGPTKTIPSIDCPTNNSSNSSQPGYTAAEERIVAERLKRLGYLE
ncbi:MAG: alkaline phosphatase family protein [Myxococcota bacterium]|nr:alkaline phosphatase family protein [Myxococcota bacterium]